MDSGITIDGYRFDLIDRPMQLPAWHGQPYSVAGMPHAGATFHPPAADPIRRRVIRFDAAANRDSIVRTWRNSVGRTVSIVAGGVVFAAAPHSIRFAILPSVTFGSRLR